MSTDLKQELDEDLSRLLKSYEQRGLDPAEIADSFEWHLTLARSRSRNPQTSDTLLESLE